MATAFLGLGSNLGDRLANLQGAVRLLAGATDIVVVASSRVWETDAVGGPPQPDYLNAVIEVRTSLSPGELLAACRRVEVDLGRVREVRWGPRTIDVDMLLFDELTIDREDLSVPHPRLTERAFALLPLLELDPDASLPDGSRLSDARLGPRAMSSARPFAPPLEVSR